MQKHHQSEIKNQLNSRQPNRRFQMYKIGLALVAVCFALLGVLIGCNQPRCYKDSDCAEGDICYKGFCNSQCSADTDCPKGEKCVEKDGKKRCEVPSVKAGCDCNVDSDCDTGLGCPCAAKDDCKKELACVDGVCSSCLVNENCRNGASMMCVNGRCRTYCQKDDDCEDGKVCSADHCVDKCKAGECPRDSKCGEDGRCTSVPCKHHSECESNQICKNGFCKTGCRFTRECAIGYYCENQVCKESVDCSQSGICKESGFICQKGHCVPGCKFSSDCDSGLICYNSRCTNMCKDDNDCGDGLICEFIQKENRQLCVIGCRNTQGCAGGEICKDRTCVKSFCKNDNDCPPDAKCHDSRCVECSSSADCKLGKLCSPNKQCVECLQTSDCPPAKMCFKEGGRCVYCLEDADCAEGTKCSATKTCVQCIADTDCKDGKKCSPKNTCVECLTKTDCKDNKQCAKDNKCVECLGDHQCSQGKKCEPSSRSCVDCIKDGDCTGGKRCNQSTYKCVECIVDGDCGSGKVCKAGFCEVKPAEPKPEVPTEGTGETTTDGGEGTVDGGETSPEVNPELQPETPETKPEVKPEVKPETTPESVCTNGSTRYCYTGATGCKRTDPSNPYVCVGLCSHGNQTCKNGQWGSCVGEVTPVTEVPGDSKDNDCDGQTDEPSTTNRECYTGPTGTKGVGECKAGKQTYYTNGAWGACVGEVTPSTETCDGKDNDCDGQTDENVSRECYNGATGTKNVGECKAGTQKCAAGKWETTCTGEVKPVTETCDNKDNNCNGSIDESVERRCYSGSTGCSGDLCKGECKYGKETCTAGSWGNCMGEVTPVAETCDGKDNDCDGAVDEDISSKSCYTATTGCKPNGDGTYKCFGTCKAGTQSCVSGAWSSCTGQVIPAIETCDNKDNDCDGSIDDNVSKQCSTVCGTGFQICTSGQWGTCSARVPDPAETKCDGKDDDCNGQIDEGLVKECYPGNTLGCTLQPDGSYNCTGTCKTGKSTCSNGSWGTCELPIVPITEKCWDKVDNDCDGQIDENCVCGSYIKCAPGSYAECWYGGKSTNITEGWAFAANGDAYDLCVPRTNNKLMCPEDMGSTSVTEGCWIVKDVVQRTQYADPSLPPSQWPKYGIDYTWCTPPRKASDIPDAYYTTCRP